MSDLSTQPYLLKFWYRPSAVVQALVEAKQGHRLASACALLFGAVQALPLYFSEETTSPMIIIFGAAVGLLGLYLFSWLMRNFGRWFGAQVKLHDMRIALGWGLLPWSLLFAVVAVMVHWSSDAESVAAMAPVFFVGFIYGYVLILLSSAAVLRLTVLKTFLCVVVTCVVSIFPLTLLAQFVAQVFDVTLMGS